MPIPVLLLALQAAPQEPQVPVGEEVVVTASAFADDPLDQPFSIDSLDLEQLRQRSRTLPEALRRTPSVLMQKTAYGQTSPFIRGFTAFRNRLLVDGVPLNHAAMRDGPNQYWSTIDSLTVERLELVRGPSSVLYGSDGIGGTVNAVSRRADISRPGFHVGGASFTRFAAPSNSWTQRLETEISEGGEWGLLAGVTASDYDDLRAGSGELPETGYREGGADFRVDRYLDNGMVLTLAGQTFRQRDVPRTHKTIFAVPFQGSDIGNELRRDQDQVRDLVYGRLSWEDRGGFLDDGEITLSYHRHAEDRDRLRAPSGTSAGNRRDRQGFDLVDLGLTARFQSAPRASGTWSWGAEIHRQTADSFRDNFDAGLFTGSSIQGSIGDDATYTSLEAYLQNEILLDEAVSIIPGVRVSRFDFEVDRVDNPDPGGPAVIGYEDDWTNLAASLRGVWYVGEQTTVYGGLSQGFRAPNFSDLTSLDATSAVETPTFGLEPEKYLQAELGTKGRHGRFGWQAAAYHTFIDDMIVQSPTGNLIGGTPEVQKDNVGDGYVQGIELSGTVALEDGWSIFADASWQQGEVDQVVFPGGSLVEAPLTRVMPLQLQAGARWEDRQQGIWFEAWAWGMDNQDELALRDQTDTSRIPPGGTPGFTVVSMAGGIQLTERVALSLSLENLGDKDYRVHGSGLNAPGFQAVSTLEVSF